MTSVRPAALAGAWYPARPADLAAAVDRCLAPGPTSPPAGRPLIALAPHAGHAWSGATAGRLYAHLRGRLPGRVVILAPNHRVRLDRIALPGATAFATPLGEVPVDTAAVAALAANPAFTVDDRAHRDEHAIEIQLPFLQRLAPDHPPRIVPMLVPPLPADLRAEAARALATLADADTLLLVSSDLTHYGAAYGYVPFTDDVPDAIERLDAGAILKVLAGDGDGLRDYGRRTGITMCGLEAAALALDTGLPAGWEGALLDYTRSGDRDRDYTMSVSYAAVLLADGRTP
ncbi:MAG TPA: AmmeMemoRadiSam system protein B [Candidatus Krumholzibacteria bacterium]|nr:AmmeMemoRadiSam system protein B [Candidatus Krumholzibacteria bacterium]